MGSDRMTVRLANEIRETSTPLRCSACFNQQPALRHVDFDASCDRGYGDDAGIQINMDDLILCENCVKNGAMVLGIEDSTELKAQVETLERKYDVEKKRREQAERWADTMESAISQRPEPLHIDHRKKPRKQIEEVAA